MKTQHTLAIFALGISQIALADSWLEQQHHQFSDQLDLWANHIDDWLGTPDPNKPASAALRVMFDSDWNRYDGYSIKPRVRGKISLPVLKKHLSIVVGDDSVDNELREKHRLNRATLPADKPRTFNGKDTRESNSSLAVRWSDGTKKFGIKTDVDLGIRSGSDLYLRFKVSKDWQHSERISTRLEQLYRYGLNSKHYLRTNFESRYLETPHLKENHRFFANHFYLDYQHDLEEHFSWGNSLYRQHNFAHYKRLDYGLFFGGDIQHKRASLNRYGPYISYRQPLWRDWLFIQPELHFYNDKTLNRPHHLGAFLRLEALF